MAAAVLLRHELSDGSVHFDWMIRHDAHAPDPDRPLMTFRVRVRIDRFGDGRDDPADAPLGACFAAEQITDHRAEYLTFEGEVSGGRGRVERMAAGVLIIASAEPDRVRFVGYLGASRGVFTGHRNAPGAAEWTFAFDPD